jgi:tRNA pseudouridine38-40 synthase
VNRYQLTIAYDGTDYHGWQIQPHCSTITQVLQDRFRQVFNKDCSIVGASRTDAGVHALGQVALLQTELELEPGRICKVFNDHLPLDIMVRKLETASNTFHPQANVQQKTYYYHFFLERPLPFIARYGYYYYAQINISKLQESLQLFTGTHDFRSFCTGDEMLSTIRTVDSVNLYFFKRYNTYRIEIKAQSFLRYMIRRVVGAALYTASRYKFSVESLQAAMQAKNPEQLFPTAPARGLMLYKIVYDKEV